MTNPAVDDTIWCLVSLSNIFTIRRKDIRRKSTNAFFVIIFIATGIFGFILPAGAEVSNPTVTGPIPVNVPLGDPSHDYPQFATQLDLASYGYVEEEFFLEGEATRYLTPPLADGTEISTGQPYKTRMIVRRPVSTRFLTAPSLSSG